MSEPRTPSTTTIRHAFCVGHPFPLTTDPDERGAEFDRWFADEIRKAKAQAWGEGITASGINLDWQLHLLDHNPYAEES